jgi:KAP family P-loop domain
MKLVRDLNLRHGCVLRSTMPNMTMQQAQTLREAIPNLDHTRGLEITELDTIYVVRPEVQDKLEELTFQLELQYPCKILLTGHRGVGKSSALTYLSKQLQTSSKLWVVHFSIVDVDLNDLDYVDIMVLMVAKILEQCRDQELKLGSAIQKRLEVWSSEIDIVREYKESSQIEAEAKTEVSIGTPGWLSSSVKAFLSVSGKIGKESATRKTIRQQVTPKYSELLGIIDDLQQAISKTISRQLVCLIDGCDKASVKASEELFYKNGHYLSIPECSIVYTFPVALQHSKEYNQILPYFTEAIPIPNFKTQTRKNPDQAEQQRLQNGISLLKEVITKRVNPNLLTQSALEKIVISSGGISRLAIKLTHKAALRALVAKTDKIEEHHVDAAINEERKVYQRMLTAKQKDLLRKARDEQDIDPDPEAGYLDLLHNLSLIEYDNGEVWYAVHPIAAPLL